MLLRRDRRLSGFQRRGFRVTGNHQIGSGEVVEDEENGSSRGLAENSARPGGTPELIMTSAGRGHNLRTYNRLREFATGLSTDQWSGFLALESLGCTED